MIPRDDMNDLDENSEDQRPRQQSLGGVLRREGNWRCLLLSTLLIGCLAAAAWCRLAQVQRIVINFSVYPIKRTRQMSPCDDGYIYIPVAFMGLLYLVYLVECYHCTARLQLAHRVDVSAVVDRVRAMRLAKPKVWWKAVCYHYVRRKRQVTRYRNGDAYTTTQVYYERVNSHSASATFAHVYCGFKDVSRNLILDSRGPITKIRFSKGFAFSNIEAASEFEDQRSRFFAEHERFDDYMEMREGLDLVGVSSFKEYMVAYRDTDRFPWYSSQVLFWVLSCLLLSWPLRILIECNTAYVHYTVTKIFGVNYDIDASRRLDMEMSQYSPPPAVALTPRMTPTLLSSQTAILANQNNSADTESGSSQQINILALARSRNGVDPGALSHTSTIDSLELFASIIENCAMVPSYSEALLLSSLEENEANPENGNENDLSASDAVVTHNSISVENEKFDKKIVRGSRAIINYKLCYRDPNQINEINDNSRPSTSTARNRNELFSRRCHHSSIEENTLDEIDSKQTNSNQSTPKKRSIKIVKRINSATNLRIARLSETEPIEENTSPKTKLPFIKSTHSTYSLKLGNPLTTKNNLTEGIKNQNRRSWAGFLSSPSHGSSTRGSARIRPIPPLGYRRNSLTENLLRNPSVVRCQDFDESASIVEESAEIEEEVSPAQIESINRNLEIQKPTMHKSQLFFSNPLLQICPSDPFGGRLQTTPTEDPPPYDVAVNLPVLRRITRSLTDRGDLFSQSRSFINDTLMNRRSYVENVVSGPESVRLLVNNEVSNDGESQTETNL